MWVKQNNTRININYLKHTHQKHLQQDHLPAQLVLVEVLPLLQENSHPHLIAVHCPQSSLLVPHCPDCGTCVKEIKSDQYEEKTLKYFKTIPNSTL